jgi:membrane protein implicated in regulation of membrane protease activity
VSDTGDGSHSTSVVGSLGVVVVGTSDPSQVGEVRVAIRGGSETYLAYCRDPLVRHSKVLVIEDLGNRKVTVEPWTGF